MGLQGTDAPPGAEEEMKKVLENMDGKLRGKKFLAGDVLTLADLSVIFNLSWLSVHPSFDFTSYPNVRRWRSTISEMPEFKKINKEFEDFIKSKLAEGRK